jgi:hypothetical protein
MLKPIPIHDVSAPVRANAVLGAMKGSIGLDYIEPAHVERVRCRSDSRLDRIDIVWSTIGCGESTRLLQVRKSKGRIEAGSAMSELSTPVDLEYLLSKEVLVSRSRTENNAPPIARQNYIPRPMKTSCDVE